MEGTHRTLSITGIFCVPAFTLSTLSTNCSLCSLYLFFQKCVPCVSLLPIGLVEVPSATLLLPNVTSKYLLSSVTHLYLKYFKNLLLSMTLISYMIPWRTTESSMVLENACMSLPPASSSSINILVDSVCSSGNHHSI